MSQGALSFAKASRQLQAAHGSSTVGLSENQDPGLCMYLVTLALLASLHSPVHAGHQDGLFPPKCKTAMLSAPISKLLEVILGRCPPLLL